MYAPYKSETQQVIWRAGMIWRANRLKCVLWAVLYMAAVNAPYILTLHIFGYLLSPVPHFWYIPGYMVYILPLPVSALLLLCLYAWLNRMIRGAGFAKAGFFGPFLWIKTRSLRRFLLNFAAVAAALLCMYYLAAQGGDLVNAFVRDYIVWAVSTFFGPNHGVAAFIVFPLLLSSLVFFMLQWIVDFHCIHAVQTGGKKTRGIIFPFSPIYKKILRVEARLIAKTLWIPFVLYYAILALSDISLSPAYSMPAYHLLMRFTFLGFGLYYFPLSAIARSLLVMNQPRAAYVPAEQVSFPEIDEEYAALVRADEARRRAEAAEEGLEDEDGDDAGEGEKNEEGGETKSAAYSK